MLTSIAAFSGDGLVEHGDAAARFFKCSAQRLESGQIFFFQARKRGHHLVRESGAGIVLHPLSFRPSSGSDMLLARRNSIGD